MRRIFFALLCLFASAAARADELLDVNAATSAQLEQLPGIGKAKAEAIVEERELNGPFRSVDELKRVKGLGLNVLQKIAPLVQVKASSAAEASASAARKDPPIELPAPPSALDHEPPSGKVNVNLATEEELQQLNGVTRANARVIVAYRRVKGPFHNLGDLAHVPGLPNRLVQTMQYFVTTRLDPNEATVSQLVTYGMSPTGAGALIAYRTQHKRIATGAEFDKIAAIPANERAQVRSLLWFEKER